MSKTLTRADLSEAIYSKVGISKVESSDIVDQIFEEMILELINISCQILSLLIKKLKIKVCIHFSVEALVIFRKVVFSTFALFIKYNLTFSFNSIAKSELKSKCRFLFRFISSTFRNNHRARNLDPPIKSNVTIIFMGTTDRGTP